MLVTKATENAFGTPVNGVHIELTASEAANIVKMVSQGFTHPPQDRSGNTDYTARELGGRLVREIEAAIK